MAQTAIVWMCDLCGETAALRPQHRGRSAHPLGWVCGHFRRRGEVVKQRAGVCPECARRLGVRDSKLDPDR